MRRPLVVVALTLAAVALADTPLFDEGVYKGLTKNINCVGGGITCTRDGGQAVVVVGNPDGGPLPASSGGTGTSLAADAGAVMYSTTTGIGATSIGDAGQMLLSGGRGPPAWGPRVVVIALDWEFTDAGGAKPSTPWVQVPGGLKGAAPCIAQASLGQRQATCLGIAADGGVVVLQSEHGVSSDSGYNIIVFDPQ